MDSSLADGPPNPSFDMRGHSAIRFPRSVSSKEPPLSDAVCLPPRLSGCSISLPLHHSQPSTPRLSFAPDASKLDVVDPASYRCISSVLKKDGQILCIAAANGLVYTGSQGNAVRVWKLPEFTECGQLKTKACMVLALQVSNDRVYAAYADCKIRVWRRTWEGVIKHVRLATIPTPASFLRGYIAGADKAVLFFSPFLFNYLVFVVCVTFITLFLILIFHSLLQCYNYLVELSTHHLRI